MTEAFRSQVSEILALTRDRDFDRAAASIDARLGAGSPDEQALLRDCRALLDWRIATTRQMPLRQGLTEAVLGVTRLREAGYDLEVGWAFVHLGYAIGLQGDFERGLEWLEIAIADARHRNDRRQLIFSISHQASLLAHADEPERAFTLYTQALSLCEGDETVHRPAFLNNLAHCRLLQARELLADDPSRARLAEQSLEYSTQAFEAAGTEHPLAGWRCSFIHNQGDALHLLGRLREAEAAYRNGLSLAENNLRVKAEVLASYAGLLMDLGSEAESADLLSQAVALTPWDMVNPSTDRILELQIQLARRRGHVDELHALWERRHRHVQDRHRDRLRTVRRFAELFDELKAVRAAEQKIREEAESERARREEQERFLAMLTHELKTPVGVARISLGAMKTSGPNTQRIERALSNINAIIERCRVTGELEHDKLQPAFERCDPGELARQCAQNCVQPGRVKISHGDLPAIRTDLLLLEIVMANLIDNALKYSPAGSDVVVTVAPKADDGRAGVAFVVTNLPGAAGLPDPQRVFGKYFRGHGAHGKSGSGLGLYLAQGISELLGGRLACVPTADRVEFSLWLPA